MLGLVIKSPWIELILAGRKTWEIRGSHTRMRERIALIKGGSGRVFGRCRIADCLGPLSPEQMCANIDKHQIPLKELEQGPCYPKTYAWVMAEPQPFVEPIPYQHPNGAVIWVRLNAQNVGDRLQKFLSDTDLSEGDIMPRKTLATCSQEEMAADRKMDAPVVQRVVRQLLDVLGSPASWTNYMWAWDGREDGVVVNVNRQTKEFVNVWVAVDSKPEQPLRCGCFAERPDSIHSVNSSNLSDRIQNGPHLFFKIMNDTDADDLLACVSGCTSRSTSTAERVAALPNTPANGRQRPTLEDAIALAVEAHRGQVDKSGQPYILHPLRVMFQCQTDAERIVAVLHDVVEDTAHGFDDLRERGYGEELLAALECVTKRKRESYEQFVERAATNPIARKVKLADLQDNMDLRRLVSVEEKDLERIQRYISAWRRLSKSNGNS